MNRPSPPDGVHLQEVGDEQQEFQPEIETGGHHTFEDLRIQHHDGAQYNAQYSIQHSQTSSATARPSSRPAILSAWM